MPKIERWAIVTKPEDGPSLAFCACGWTSRGIPPESVPSKCPACGYRIPKPEACGR